MTDQGQDAMDIVPSDDPRRPLPPPHYDHIDHGNDAPNYGAAGQPRSPAWEDGLVPEIAHALNQPLTRAEIVSIKSVVDKTGIQPGPRFKHEMEMEMKRIDILIENGTFPDDDLRDLCCKGEIGIRGTQARCILARSIIRQRWEGFHIWNSTWGIPGIGRSSVRDDFDQWCWPWQDDDPDRAARQSQQAARLVVEARLGRGRMDRLELEPQATPPQVPDAHQAENFLTTRPWFLYQLEVTEELRRLARLADLKVQNPNELSARKLVLQRWIARGIWSASWPLPDEDGWSVTPGWRWGHELPEGAQLAAYREGPDTWNYDTEERALLHKLHGRNNSTPELAFLSLYKHQQLSPSDETLEYPDPKFEFPRVLKEGEAEPEDQAEGAEGVRRQPRRQCNQ